MIHPSVIRLAACLLCPSLLSAETPSNALDARIRGILSQMSDQEKIDQLFYKAAGHERLGIPQSPAAARTAGHLIAPSLPL